MSSAAQSYDFEALAGIGRQAGLSAVGVCSAAPFSRTADTLQQRSKQGLHGGMAFTYRNPQRSSDPARSLPGATALIVGALDFKREPPPQPEAGPCARVASYVWSDHYKVLRSALGVMARRLTDAGHHALVSADENSLVDRAAAYRAGLGWWGKSSNILVPGSGSMVVLGSVITDAPWSGADPAAVADGCGSCSKCLDSCPTGAIVSAGVIDARRCLAWLLQAPGVFDPDHRVALGNRLYGCDDCQDACPPNRVRLRSRSGGADPATTAGDSDPQPWVRLLDLLESDDTELMATYGRWYIPQRQPRYLRRNALVVLANIADRDDPRVRANVAAALQDPDALIRAHAVWCARRLGYDLEALGLGEQQLRAGSDPLVEAELARSVVAR